MNNSALPSPLCFPRTFHGGGAPGYTFLAREVWMGYRADRGSVWVASHPKPQTAFLRSSQEEPRSLRPAASSAGQRGPVGTPSSYQKFFLQLLGAGRLVLQGPAAEGVSGRAQEVQADLPWCVH